MPSSFRLQLHSISYLPLRAVLSRPGPAAVGRDGEASWPGRKAAAPAAQSIDGWKSNLEPNAAQRKSNQLGA